MSREHENPILEKTLQKSILVARLISCQRSGGGKLVSYSGTARGFGSDIKVMLDIANGQITNAKAEGACETPASGRIVARFF